MDDDLIFGDMVVQVPRHPRADRLKEAATRYAEYLEKQDEIKSALSYIKESLLSDLPEEPGDYPIEMDDGRVLRVTIPEKWSWDKKVLKDTYEVAGLPECVSQSFTVDRKKYEAAPDNVKEVLRKALTIECGLPTIKVTS